MSGKQKQRSGGTKKYGRCSRKNSKVQYKARNQRARNKVKRIAQSNGPKALATWKKYQDSHRQLNHKGVYFPRVKRGKRVNHAAIEHVNYINGKYTFATDADAQAFADAVMNGDVPDKDAS